MERSLHSLSCGFPTCVASRSSSRVPASPFAFASHTQNPPFPSPQIPPFPPPGTSTNLVVVGLAQQRIPGFSMGIFDIGQIGLPVLFAGLLYIVVFGPRFLPDRGSVTSILQRPREYITVMFVRKADDPEGGSTLGGKTVSNAGLRSLPGLYLVRIERENHHVITAPSPDDILQGGDKLFFAGVVDSVLSLRQIRGLRLAENEVGAAFWAILLEQGRVSARMSSGQSCGPERMSARTAHLAASFLAFSRRVT